jgi:RNA polymerase sigma-70 factor, ECF subfamily
MDENRYIDQVLQGNVDSFTYFVNTYKNMVFSIAFRITNDENKAEEIAQETFIKAFKGLNKFNRQSKFSSWLYRICHNTAMSSVRQKKHKHVEIDPEINQGNYTENNDAINQLYKEDQKELINKALNQLSANERLVITLFYLEEHALDEINQITGLSNSNIKVILHRSRKKLHTILKHLLSSEITTIS